MIESAICLIDRGRLYYRGRDVSRLAETATFEEVAALLWTGDPQAAEALFGRIEERAADRAWPFVSPLPAKDPLARCQAALALAGAEDPTAWDLRPATMASTGVRVLRLVAGVLAGASVEGSEPAADAPIAERLARTWGLAPDADAGRVLSSALVLCADHELNVSAFTARCVASAEAPLYDAVIAGLAALKGRRHGGVTERVQALLRETGTPAAARETLAARLRRGEEIPGFGHPLYPQGDPRAAALLRLARSATRDGARQAGDDARRAMALVDAVVDAADQILGERPTLDLGLVAVARALDLPDCAPLALFAAGRTAGWIAHAIEQAESGRLIRPRARYTGPPPEGGTAD